jgi:hypothetical protein
MPTPHRRDVTFAMAIQKDAFRQFQEELAALDKEQKARRDHPNEKPMDRARREFLELRERHHLTVADVVAFFPEEEGIAYLQSLIAASESPPRKRRVSKKAQQED